MTLDELFEAFDSKLDIQWSKMHGGGEAGGFLVNDTKYVIQLTPIVIGDLDVMEASFHLYSVPGDKAFASTGKSKSPMAVYGVVVNALIDKLQKLKCDAVFFSTERRHSTDDEQHESKIKLYKFAAQRIAKKLGWETYLNENEFLLTRKYEGKSIKAFKHWQQAVQEALGDPMLFQTLKRNP